MGSGSTSVIQVTNIAPTVTNEQLRTLLAFVGTIREFTVYPSNDPAQQMARVCYVKYLDPMSVCVAQHLTNTVFIDRAIFVKPISDGKIPDEVLALKLANEGHSQNSSNSGVVSQVANVNGTQSITTIDPRLNALGLPQYPPLPANLDPSKIEEIRRTVSVSNVSQYTTPESILEFFNQFGEVKYLRMTSSEGDIIKSALIEFTDQSSVANALQNTGTTLNGLQLSINHSNTSILKPQHNPADGEKFYESREVKGRSKDSRSPVHSRRGRSPSRRSRSPHRSRSDRRRSGSRSRSHERRRRSRSRERRRSPERRRSRSRSYSKERNRERSRRGRSKDRDRHQSSKNRSIERDRSRKNLHHDRRREHSNEHRSKDRDRERSSRTRDHRSRDSERKDRHRSKRDKERRRSRSRSKSKNEPNKKENSVLPLEIIKAEEMDISEDKNEPDNYSVKSEGGSSSMKSSSSRRSSSQSRSHGKIDKKREKLYDSEEEFSLKF